MHAPHHQIPSRLPRPERRPQRQTGDGETRNEQRREGRRKAEGEERRDGNKLKEEGEGKKNTRREAHSVAMMNEKLSLHHKRSHPLR